MDSVTRTLAIRLGVLSKIDPQCDDAEYIAAWRSKLHEFDALAKRAKGLPAPSLESVRADTWTNVEGILAKTRKTLDEDSDLGPLALALAAADEEATNVEGGNTEHRQPPTPWSGTSHLIDVDIEYTSSGSQVVLYCRDIATEASQTVLVPWYDYFYIEITEEHTTAKIQQALRGHLWYLTNKRFPEEAMDLHENPSKYYGRDLRRHSSRINLALDMLVKTEEVKEHRSIYGYQPTAGRFLRITTRYPTVTRALFQGLSRKHATMKFFEADTDATTKFLTAAGVTGCGAISVVGTRVSPNTFSYDDILIREASVRPAQGAPLYVPRMMYLDIECLSLQENVFPTPDSCPVIQISYLLARGVDGELKRGVLCLRDTPGWESFETEERLLIRFGQLVREFNPDAIAGFNSNAFDMPYILDRMRALGIHGWASEITRRRGFKMDYQRSMKSSNQAGSREITKYVCPGRVMFDLFEIISGDVTKKLRSYSLKSICAEYLGEDNKEDIRYKDIPVLFDSPAGRTKLANYCMKDTDLLIKLDKVLLLGTTCWGMAKVLGTTAQAVLSRGLVFKIMNKLKQYSERYKFLIPSFPRDRRPKCEDKYQGAFVLDPELGFHRDPIVTLDFASLYPSLMMAYNLSYDTFLWDRELAAERPQDFQEHCGYLYARPEVHRGVLPRLQEELARERKEAKRKRDTFPEGSPEWEVYESLQLANKVIMNSCYGALGSPTATVPNVEIAKTITGLGRDNLLNAKAYVEANYQRITGEAAPARCIYGDTDSVFILMPGISIAQAIHYGQMIEREIQRDVFDARPPMKLAYEKTMCPFVITRKKGYIGAKYEFDPTQFKVKAMGIQLVRRDSAVLCLKVMQGFVDEVFKNNNVPAAVRFVEAMLSDMFADRLPLEDYVITKKIAKAEYKVEPPHISEWKRERARVGRDDVEAVGERMEFVVAQFRKGDGMKNAIVRLQRAREEGHVDINKDHYFETFVRKPLLKIMEYIAGAAETQRVMNPASYERVRTVKASRGNLLGFFGKSTMTSRKRQRVAASRDDDEEDI